MKKKNKLIIFISIIICFSLIGCGLETNINEDAEVSLYNVASGNITDGGFGNEIASILNKADQSIILNNSELYRIEEFSFIVDEIKKGGVFFDGVSSDETEEVSAQSEEDTTLEQEEVADESMSAIQSYYDRSVFIGDSLMVGYSTYCMMNEDSCGYYSDFLCCTSYSLLHAINPVEDDSLQPTYMGEKMNVWSAIELMDVDRVFLMFGINDLISYNSIASMNYYVRLINKIREVNPDIEIIVIGMTPIAAGASLGYLDASSVVSFDIMLSENQSTYNYKYLDLYSYIADGNGNLPADICSDDFCHMTTIAYKCFWEAAFRDFAISQTE